MDPTISNVDAVYAEENDAEEIITLDDAQETADDASWITEDEGSVQMESDEDDDEDEEEEDDVSNVPVRDDSVGVFRGHTSEVYCVSIDPVSCALAVTGGKDDRAFVWNVNDGAIRFECTGHGQSVVSVSFNCKGTLVATGDLDGLVIVWKVEDGTLVDRRQFSEIQWLQWHQLGDVLMVGTGSSDGTGGDIVLWDVPSGQERYLPGHGTTRCNVGKFLPDGKRAIAGYDSGAVKVWSLRNSTCVHTFNAHRESVTAVDCHSDKDLLLSASVDNTTCLLHAGNGQILKIYHHQPQPRSLNTEDEETGVFAAAFSPSSDFKFLATGMKSGLLTIWDYATHSERVRCQHTAGVERLIWHSNGFFIFTCTVDGKICLWDARNGQELGCWRGHWKGIYDMDLSRNGSCLVTVSYDRTARVFNPTNPGTV